MCGKELISMEKVCLECQQAPVLISVDKMLPLFSYRLWNKEILFLWKIRGIRSFSAFFASCVNKALKQMNIKYIVPVPPRPGKIQKNGWDQIDELCRFLNIYYKYKILNLLVRKSEKQQKKLDRESRLETINNAYSLISERKFNKLNSTLSEDFPEKICIIDDVCTTGSTIECCAKILKEKTSIKEVFALTLFTVD